MGVQEAGNTVTVREKLIKSKHNELKFRSATECRSHRGAIASVLGARTIWRSSKETVTQRLRNKQTPAWSPSAPSGCSSSAAAAGSDWGRSGGTELAAPGGVADGLGRGSRASFRRPRSSVSRSAARTTVPVRPSVRSHGVGVSVGVGSGSRGARCLAGDRLELPGDAATGRPGAAPARTETLPEPPGAATQVRRRRGCYVMIGTVICNNVAAVVKGAREEHIRSAVHCCGIPSHC